jgi:nucleosome binding factor SPN SPT16 subunit
MKRSRNATDLNSIDIENLHNLDSYLDSVKIDYYLRL